MYVSWLKENVSVNDLYDNRALTTWDYFVGYLLPMVLHLWRKVLTQKLHLETMVLGNRTQSQKWLKWQVGSHRKSHTIPWCCPIPFLEIMHILFEKTSRSVCGNPYYKSSILKRHCDTNLISPFSRYRSMREKSPSLHPSPVKTQDNSHSK